MPVQRWLLCGDCEGDMFITAERLFDGLSDSIVVDPLIEVSDDRIVRVTQGRSISDTDVIDLGDATLLPGLIDVHQHLAFDASGDAVAQLAQDDDATLLLRMRAAAMRALGGGITTIRKMMSAREDRTANLLVKHCQSRGTMSWPSASPIHAVYSR